MCIHSEAASRAESIAQIKVSSFSKDSTEMIFLDMVLTTSPPAMSAPAASKIAAMASAAERVSAFEPTAGPHIICDVVGANVHRHIGAAYTSGYNEGTICIMVI